MSKHENKGKKSIYRTISIISAVVAILAVIAIGVFFISIERAQREYEELSAATKVSPEITPTPEPTAVPESPDPSSTPEPTPEVTPEPVWIPIDFDYLQSVNSDAIAWIYVDGTDIDYPILYDATDDVYYLSHTYTGTYQFAGSILILADDNNSDFSDYNTVVYGHNMNNGSMFAQLHRFEKEDFFDENRNIVVYTNHSKLTYWIFAAYKTDNLSIIRNNDFSTEEGYGEYLDTIYDHSGFFNDEVPVTTSDRIITLSTCIGDANYRYLVQGVLISEEAGE